MAGDYGLTRTTMTMKPSRCLFQPPQPTDLPVTEAGAERHCGLETKELGFELHVFTVITFITSFHATVKLLCR
jgi:hypothetical protein